MNKGLYTAASGMMLQLAKQDVLANNVANASTSGYKKQTTVSRAFPEMLISRLEASGKKPAGKKFEQIGKLGSGACLDEVYTDYSMGNMLSTGNPCDLAINRGFFVVETPQGERFTRNGSFKVNFDGLLTSSQGYPVLDAFDDYIYIEGDLTVDRQGNITVNEQDCGRFKIVDFDDPSLLYKVGNNLFASPQEYYEPDNPEVMQGYLEQSNVNAVKEMIDLMSSVRIYETLQKVVHAEDELTQVAIDRVGSVQ